MSENEQETVQQKPEPIRIPLEDRHVEMLEQQFDILQSYYVNLGSALCDILEQFESAKALRRNIAALQEDICRELRVPRAERILWRLNRKCLEIPSPND